MSGAISASGSSTNRRSRNLGCGTMRPGSSMIRSAEQDQIQIQRPGRAGKGTLASALPFDRHQRVEQRPRRQRRLADGDGIQKIRLVAGDVHRLGVDGARDLEAR